MTNRDVNAIDMINRMTTRFNVDIKSLYFSCKGLISRLTLKTKTKQKKNPRGNQKRIGKNPEKMDSLEKQVDQEKKRPK